jgi:hypothetical protein
LNITTTKHLKTNKIKLKFKKPIARITATNIMERIKNDMGDFVIDGKLTIKELYELAKKDGFENRNLFFSIKNKNTKQHIFTDTVVDFGKGWTHDSVIMHLTWEDLPVQDTCPE